MLSGDRRPAVIARCFRSVIRNRKPEMDVRTRRGTASEVEVRVTRRGQLFTPIGIVDGLKLEGSEMGMFVLFDRDKNSSVL